MHLLIFPCEQFINRLIRKYYFSEVEHDFEQSQQPHGPLSACKIEENNFIAPNCISIINVSNYIKSFIACYSSSIERRQTGYWISNIFD